MVVAKAQIHYYLFQNPLIQSKNFLQKLVLTLAFGVQFKIDALLIIEMRLLYIA